MSELPQSFLISKLEPPPTIDGRIAFLERASVRLFLVNAGEMELGEAFDGLVGSLQCACERDTVDRWERDFPSVRRGRR